jgi:WD40-like Beta Propeller Repeat
VTSHPAATDTFPSFSHDGQWIYFSSTRTGAPSIWKIPTSGGAAVQVSAKFGLLAIESLDGAYVYFVESRTLATPGPLWRVPIKGGEPVKLVDGVAATSFDVVDTGIYYLEPSAETRLRSRGLFRQRPECSSRISADRRPRRHSHLPHPRHQRSGNCRFHLTVSKPQNGQKP